MPSGTGGTVRCPSEDSAAHRDLGLKAQGGYAERGRYSCARLAAALASCKLGLGHLRRPKPASRRRGPIARTPDRIWETTGWGRRVAVRAARRATQAADCRSRRLSRVGPRGTQKGHSMTPTHHALLGHTKDTGQSQSDLGGLAKKRPALWQAGRGLCSRSTSASLCCEPGRAPVSQRLLRSVRRGGVSVRSIGLTSSAACRCSSSACAAPLSSACGRTGPSVVRPSSAPTTPPRVAVRRQRCQHRAAARPAAGPPAPAAHGRARPRNAELKDRVGGAAGESGV